MCIHVHRCCVSLGLLAELFWMNGTVCVELCSGLVASHEKTKTPKPKNACCCCCCCSKRLKSWWVSRLMKHRNVQVMQNVSQKRKHGFIKCRIFVIIRVSHFGEQAAVLISEFFSQFVRTGEFYEAACWGNDVRHNGEVSNGSSVFSQLRPNLFKY